jgi:hypothetical protein
VTQLPLADLEGPAAHHPPFRLKARAARLFQPADAKTFQTVEVPSLVLDLDGLPFGRHRGPTRRSGGREPWYPRGTVIRNERQVTLVAADELAAIAAALGIPAIQPEWLGATLVIEGVPNLTLVPPRAAFHFAGGATIRVDGLNKPCRLTGRAIAAHHPGREDLEFAFVTAARYRRGLVGWVEKPGVVAAGEAAELRVPEQRMYRG